MLSKILQKYKRFGLFGLFRVIISAIRYYFMKYMVRAEYMVRKIHDYKLKLDLKDLGIARELVINGTREQQLRYLLKKEIENGMRIVDIGANIGYYAIMEAKLAGKKGFVYAIEPDKKNYQQLLNLLSALHTKIHQILQFQKHYHQ